MWMRGAAGADGTPDWEAMRRMSPPENELPVRVALRAVLTHTQVLVVAVTGARVYSSGVLIELTVRTRERRQDLFEVVSGGRRPSTFLLGLEFADGRRAGPSPDLVPVPDRPSLVPSGGGGSDGMVDQEYWLTPMPPAGPMRIVLRCTGLGIEEVSVTVDAAPLTAATADVVTLWPWEPPDLGDDGPPPMPVLPHDSWFRGT